MTLSTSHETLLDHLFLELIAKVKARLQSQSQQLPKLGLPHDSAAAAAEAGQLIESVYYQQERYAFPIILEELRKNNQGIKENVIDLLVQFCAQASLSDGEGYAALEKYISTIPFLENKPNTRNYAAKLQQLRQAE